MTKQHLKKSSLKGHIHKAVGRHRLKFPSINRLITDWRFWSLSISILLILFVVTLGFKYLHLKYELKQKEAQRQQVEKEIVFWGQITQQYSDYRDAYFKLALLKYQVGNVIGAKEALNHALELDANFEKGRELEKILNNL